MQQFFGTSPRMRGKRPDIDKLEPAIRNIPAYAGKTEFSPLSMSDPTEHPRVCGENFGAKES